MENASFAKTDGGFFMNDEDAEYDFLYHTIPELEKPAGGLCNDSREGTGAY